MAIVLLLFRVLGGLCLFLYGMKILSDGIQQAVGERLQNVLNFMTGNRFIAVFTGFAITALVQSSSATTVMLVSFVNAGLLTLTQAAGVIMGANIGTTTTAWIVAQIGYQFDISSLALPAVGIGFMMRLPKWKHRDWGEVLLGFGFLFIGLEFINSALPRLDPASIEFIGRFSGRGMESVLIALVIGTVITLLMHSSAATITLVMALAYREVIDFDTSAALILGANIGTTIDAIMAAFGAKTTAKQTALVHVLFNVAGSVIAVIFLHPLIVLVDILTPGSMDGVGITTHLAMFHTVFNSMCTLLFLPFVRSLAALVAFLIKPKAGEEEQRHYKLDYQTGTIYSTPELNIVRAEKEIRDMAGLVSAMYAQVSEGLGSFSGADIEAAEAEKTAQLDSLVVSMKAKEDYADEMREELTRFLIECTRQQLSPRSEYNISQLLRIIADLEDMADDCCGIALTLERSVKKKQLFKKKEMEALTPFVGQVEEFLGYVRQHLGHPLNRDQIEFAESLESEIDRARNKLRKLGRKRIEAGADVKTELLFIDLVRRIERLGDFCYDISEALFHMS
ncbi:MAG: Na/Pi cotransporter family protein [Treponema sp.]|jgi:phosphate:Na+ symporter|nr:Na/Pi cotransporter family protein [Treponema sp.]